MDPLAKMRTSPHAHSIEALQKADYLSLKSGRLAVSLDTNRSQKSRLAEVSVVPAKTNLYMSQIKRGSAGLSSQHIDLSLYPVAYDKVISCSSKERILTCRRSSRFKNKLPSMLLHSFFSYPRFPVCSIAGGCSAEPQGNRNNDPIFLCTVILRYSIPFGQWSTRRTRNYPRA